MKIHSKRGVKNVPILSIAWLKFSQPQVFFVYTCSMRDALRNLHGKQIVLEDGTCFFYTTNPYEMKNALETVVAVLEEYSFTKKDSVGTYKLYRTKEGNWYDLTSSENKDDYRILRSLKAAFDSMQNATT